MAVPTLPSIIRLSDVQAEFGGSYPINMRGEYLAGGGLVPSGTANATGVLIPSSGTLRLSNFSGASSVIIQVLARSPQQTVLDPADALASSTFNSNGTWSGTSQTGYNWRVGGSSSDYDVRYTKSSGTGTLSGLSDNVWYNLGTTRTVSLSRTFLGSVSWTGTVAIRQGSTIISSASYTFLAEVFNLE